MPRTLATANRDNRFATQKEWSEIEKGLLATLREAPHRYHNLFAMAKDNLTTENQHSSKVRRWRDVAMCIMRSECKTHENPQGPSPTLNSFQAMVQLINIVLDQLSKNGKNSNNLRFKFYNNKMPLRADIESEVEKLKEASDSGISGIARQEAENDLKLINGCYFLFATMPQQAGVDILAGGPIHKEILRPAPLTADAISRLGTLLVATTEWDPFIQYPDDSDNSSSPKGLYYDLLKMLCETTGLKINARLFTPNEAIEGLQRGHVHCALGFVDTPLRRTKKLRFVASFHTCEFIAIVRTDRPRSISSARDLADVLRDGIGGDRILVRDESGGHDVARDMFCIPKNCLRQNATPQPIDILDELVKPKAKFALAAISDGVTYQKFLSERKELGEKPPVKALPSLTTLRSGFMIHESEDAIAEWLQKEVHRIIRSEEFRTKENNVLKPYEKYVQKCWVPGI